ncbi:helix-turn-helix domain-containing protein [Thermomonospora umbrina]|uniref:Helix-turn-helix protein n=1 Tax=Thermomonospora umbrina TaxID=111806 RepID=A0A3D9SGX1_9ACTN|nr:helix-turn-helix transcriptional regulator [Thermomonospora umbrina]REE95158.1 helix-turn-helix protein [Thermomonospora umbrina]
MKQQRFLQVDGDSLRRLRLGHRLRQADLASVAGIDTSYLSLLETGRRRRASLAVVQRLAEALAVDMTELGVNEQQLQREGE